MTSLFTLFRHKHCTLPIALEIRNYLLHFSFLNTENAKNARGGILETLIINFSMGACSFSKSHTTPQVIMQKMIVYGEWKDTAKFRACVKVSVKQSLFINWSCFRKTVICTNVFSFSFKQFTRIFLKWWSGMQQVGLQGVDLFACWKFSFLKKAMKKMGIDRPK